MLHVESGWVPPDTRVDEMESRDPHGVRADLRQAAQGHLVRHVLLRLFEISRRFNMEVQPQLILLQKTLLNIEGLGRDLYPELDIWKTASPILRDWMRERVERALGVQEPAQAMAGAIEAARVLPALLATPVQRAQNGRFGCRSMRPRSRD